VIAIDFNRVLKLLKPLEHSHFIWHLCKNNHADNFVMDAFFIVEYRSPTKGVTPTKGATPPIIQSGSLVQRIDITDPDT
jgi:hypothetical protein